MMLQYIAYLDEVASQNPSNENLEALREAVWLSDKFGGSEWGRAGVARKNRGIKADTLASFMIQRMEENGVDELTKGQKQATEAMFNEIQAAKEAFENYVKEKEKELTEREAKLKLEEFSKKQSNSKKRKTSQELASERADILSSIRKKVRDNNSLSFLGAGVLSEVAPDVLKLARNLVESGVVKLQELVDTIHELLQEDLPDIDKSEINSIIAGKYNKKLPTRTELAERWQDLKTEANLIDKYIALESGEVPSNEKERIKHNQRLKELREKIKNHPLTKEGEQRKADAKRLAELQDKLARLENGEEPDLTPRERRQLSEEEKELREKIKNHDLQQLAETKRKLKTQIKQYKDKLDNGEFRKEEEKEEVPLDEEGRRLKKELNKAKHNWTVALQKDRYERRTNQQKALDKIAKVANIPRSIMASMDISAIFNQGLIPVLSHPSIGLKAIGQMRKSMFSGDEFKDWHEEIKDSPRYSIAIDSGLRITDPYSPFLEAREEVFGGGYAEVAADKIFGEKRNPLRIPERAYTQFLNKMRWDLFNRLVDKWEYDGKTIRNSKDLYEFTAKFVNDITGSGHLPFGLEQYAGFFNSLFFSPRMLMSRLWLLAAPYYMYHAPKELRGEYLKEMGKSMATVAAVVMAFYLRSKMQDDDDPNKFSVELDPRSSDFFKIRQGNTRWNPLGGFQPILRLGAQVAMRQRKSTTTGQVTSLSGDNPYGDLS